MISGSARFGPVISLATTKSTLEQLQTISLALPICNSLIIQRPDLFCERNPAQVAVYRYTCTPGDGTICCSLLPARAFLAYADEVNRTLDKGKGGKKKKKKKVLFSYTAPSVMYANDHATFRCQRAALSSLAVHHLHSERVVRVHTFCPNAPLLRICTPSRVEAMRHEAASSLQNSLWRPRPGVLALALPGGPGLTCIALFADTALTEKRSINKRLMNK